MKHFLNDIEVTPRNVLNIGLNSDFTGRPETLNLDVDTIILPRKGRDLVLEHIQNVGLFEGIPYRIQTEDGTNLNYYVDLTDDAKFRDFEVEVKIKKRLGQDSFFDNANGTSFELMNAKGVQFDFILSLKSRHCL